MLKNQKGDGFSTVQTTGSDEIEQIYRELVVELNKPGHAMQPKNLKWAYATALKNRRERTFGTTDAQGNDRAPIVIEITLDRLAQRVYQDVMRLATDEEISAHKEAQKLMKEKINRLEVERKRNEVAV